MRKEQRDDARGTKSVRGVPWQQTSAETAESQLVASVRSTETVVEPRERMKLIGSVVGDEWNSQNADFPGIGRDAVWQRRETRC